MSVAKLLYLHKIAITPAFTRNLDYMVVNTGNSTCAWTMSLREPKSFHTTDNIAKLNILAGYSITYLVAVMYMLKVE